jgi:hypothetical protein
VAPQSVNMRYAAGEVTKSQRRPSGKWRLSRSTCAMPPAK